MKRWSLTFVGLVVGVAVGAIIMMAAQGVSSGPSPTTTPSEGPSTTAPATPPPPPETTEPEQTAPPQTDQVLLVWTPGALPAGFPDQVAGLPGVSTVTTVRSGQAHVTETRNANGEVVDRPQTGFVIPIEVIAFDQDTYPDLLSRTEASAFLEVGEGELILGHRSALLRGIGPGGEIEFAEGVSLTVAAVVDDILMGAAEAALPAQHAEPLGVSDDRYLLVRYSGDRHDLESSVRDELPHGVAVRIRAPGETPVLRHGDAVLPQVMIKEQFGEFAYRLGQGESFQIEPGWVEDNIVITQIPLVGTVTCHRNLIPALTGAMEELELRGLGFLIDPDGYRGCHNARYIAGGRGISRHAWGAAIDLNVDHFPAGQDTAQDPRLIEVMERWGFTSGHEWLIPDPGHFEYFRPPASG